MDLRKAMAGCATVAETVDGLTAHGFGERFRAHEGGLLAIERGEAVRTEDLVIRAYYRFEGVSDPDDMAIVYAVETRAGVRGTITDAFGVYSDPAIGAALADVPIREWQFSRSSADPPHFKARA
jgi:hypothetical protein